MSGLLLRDNRAISFALRDAVGGQSSVGAKIDALTITGAASYFTEAQDVGSFSEGILFAFTSSHGGTNPTLDIKIQYSPDNIHWIDSGDAFTQITTTDGLFLKKLTANFGKYVRCVAVLGGTSSPNYKLSLWLVAKA